MSDFLACDMVVGCLGLYLVVTSAGIAGGMRCSVPGCKCIQRIL